MQTNIDKKFKHNPQVDDAENILRACVHCGFCTATCPTYQLLGDELDGPRGRIYLIKQILEGEKISEKTQTHLDRCLTCRACETTCPSGVRYGRLVEIGREIVEQYVPRTFSENMQRRLLRKILPYPQRFAPLLKAGQWFKPLLPDAIGKFIPEATYSDQINGSNLQRKMLVLQGCVQSVASPQTNLAAKRVFQKLGIDLVSAATAGCCGAVSHHLAAREEGLNFMRHNINAWWPYVNSGDNSVEAIIVTASGCGAVVKDYGELLKHDPLYAKKAAHISKLCKDISEVVHNEPLSSVPFKADRLNVAFHSPCTLQHGQQLNGVVESILLRVGFKLTAVENPHLCCGSAGTYSILQPRLSQQFLGNKVVALQKERPDVIATANIGCQMHIASKASVPVKHWIELINDII